MRRSPARRAARGASILLLGLVAIATSACGSSSAPPATTDTPATGAPTMPVATDVPIASATEPPATEAPASLAPGTIAYRVVNEGTAAVDVWLRSQGVVTAAAGQLGVVPGGVTADLFPPEPGTVVVLPAGTGDPTCVSDCGFLAESSTNFGEGGLRILVVGADGTAPEFWADPKPESVGTIGNALPLADPTSALLVIDAGGMADAKFGLNVGFEGVNGCVADAAASGLLLGGTTVLGYELPAEGAKVSVYPASDKTCSGTAVGGPFPLDPVTVGMRSFLLLWGPSGTVQGLAMPLD